MPALDTASLQNSQNALGEFYIKRILDPVVSIVVKDRGGLAASLRGEHFGGPSVEGRVVVGTHRKVRQQAVRRRAIGPQAHKKRRRWVNNRGPRLGRPFSHPGFIDPGRSDPKNQCQGDRDAQSRQGKFAAPGKPTLGEKTLRTRTPFPSCSPGSQ